MHRWLDGRVADLPEMLDTIRVSGTFSSTGALPPTLARSFWRQPLIL
jgi:hypothetical protein